jgi:hypothetical protein
MRIRRLGALTIAALLAGGALAACGGDDSDDGGTGLEDVEGSDGGSDTTVDVGDLEGLSGECRVFIEAAAAFAAAFGGGEDADFGDIGDAMREFADDAPDEIRGDVEVLAEAYTEFGEAVGDVDFSDPDAFSDPEVQARFAEAGEIFNDPEVVEANENVTAFTEANCQTE